MTYKSGIISIVTAILIILGSAHVTDAQTAPAYEEGIKAFGSFSSGVFDSVDLENLTLNLHIPILSYPQRGGKLHLGFAVQYANQSFTSHAISCGAGQICIVISHPGTTVSIQPDFVLVTGYNSGHVWSPDGSSHLASLITGSPSTYVTTDGSAFRVPAAPLACSTQNGSGTETLIERNGVRTVEVCNVTPRSLYLEDPNGNQIKTNSNSSGLLTGWTDTIGRTIPGPGAIYPGAPSIDEGYDGWTVTTDYTNCTGSLPTSIAFEWNLPGMNGGSLSYKICYASVYVNIPSLCNGTLLPCFFGEVSTPQMQSIVLPNGTAWTFQYDSAAPATPTSTGYGDLIGIVLPTGGTISYTWTSLLLDPNGYCYGGVTGGPFERILASRTVNANDGTGPHTSTDNQIVGPGSPPTIPNLFTTVQDAFGNQSVHTFTPQGSTCSYYETKEQDYQGSSSSGTLLKTIVTDYVTSVNAGSNGFSGTNIVPAGLPIRKTITWPNGQQTKEEKDYEFPYTTSSHSYPISDGSVIADRVFDYANGTAGPLLRTTTTTYEAISYAAYENNNLVDLPFSVKITNGSGTQLAYQTYTYDSVGVVSSGVSTQRNSNPLAGTARGNQSSVSRWLSTSGSYLVNYATYFDTGMIQSSTDPRGKQSTYVYSSTYAGGFPTSMSNPLNQLTTNTYDLNTGLVTSTTDPNGQTTSFAYDSLTSRLTQTAYSDGGQINYCYSDTPTEGCASGPPYSVVTTQKLTASVTLRETALVDGFGRLSQTQLNSDSSGTDFSVITYDALGREASITNPYRTSGNVTPSTAGVTTFQYDPLNRPTRVIEQDGSSVQTQYCGASTLVTDEAGHWRRSVADGAGRLIEVDEPNSMTASVGACAVAGDPIWATQYGYDALGDLISVNQGGSRNRNFTYDSLSRLTGSTNPETGTSPVTYTYDGNGNVLTRTDARGIVVTYTYDSVNRMSGRTYSNGDPAVTYTYDQPACLGQPTCFNIGRRTSMTDAAGSEAWSYDRLGRGIANQRITNGITKVSAYTYNLDGSLASMTYPTGRTINYAYNAAAQPYQAQDISNSISYVTNGVYNSTGSMITLTSGTAYNSTFIYNSRLEPCWIYATAAPASLPWNSACTGAVSPGAILDIKLNFNSGADNGNVIGIPNNRDSTRTQQFTYDQVNRLATARTTATTGSNCWGLNFGYDQWANLTTAGVSQCSAPALALTMNTNNRITNPSFTYDASGNLVTDGSSTYAWNGDSKIKSVAGVTYTYDGDGKRVEKSSGKIYWYGASGNVMDETDLSGSTTNASFNEYVYFGGQRVARRDYAGNIFYYFSDQIGTSRAVAEVLAGQSGGTLCYDADFYPFGGERTPIVNSCAQNYKFTAKERDIETNNDNSIARFYSSSFARFTSPDPAGLLAADQTNPQSWNMYSYVLNNPLKYVDPTGLYCYYGDVNVASDAMDVSQYDFASSKSECETPDENGNAGVWFDDSWNATVIINGGDEGGNGSGLPPAGCAFTYMGGVLTGTTCAGPEQSFADCVKKSGEDFSLQRGVQKISGGRLGNGWVSDALLGNSVSDLIDGVQKIGQGHKAAGAGGIGTVAAVEGAGHLEKVAETIPNLAVVYSSTTLDVSATGFTATTTRIAATVPTGALARGSARVLAVAGLWKDAYDISLASFASVVCSVGR